MVEKTDEITTVDLEQARQAFADHLERMIRGGRITLSLLLGLLMLSNVVRSCSIVAGVGLGQYSRGGGISSLIWELFSLGVVIGIVWFGVGPLLRQTMGQLLVNGRLARARLTSEVAPMSQRFGGGGAGAILGEIMRFFELLVRSQIPTLVVNYNFKALGVEYKHLLAGLYTDQTLPGPSVEQFVLVDVNRPSRVWLVRL